MIWSSTVAEEAAAGEARKQGLYLRKRLKSVGFGCNGSAISSEDNKSTTTLSEGSGALDKHISVRWHGIRQWISEGKLTLKYVQKGEHLSDILTKGLSRKEFQNLRNTLVLCNLRERRD